MRPTMRPVPLLLLVVVIVVGVVSRVNAHNEPHPLDRIKPEAITIQIDNSIVYSIPSLPLSHPTLSIMHDNAHHVACL
jgi:hypothetical protein